MAIEGSPKFYRRLKDVKVCGDLNVPKGVLLGDTCENLYICPSIWGSEDELENSIMAVRYGPGLGEFDFISDKDMEVRLFEDPVYKPSEEYFSLEDNEYDLIIVPMGYRGGMLDYYEDYFPEYLDEYKESLSERNNSIKVSTRVNDKDDTSSKFPNTINIRKKIYSISKSKKISGKGIEKLILECERAGEPLTSSELKAIFK